MAQLSRCLLLSFFRLSPQGSYWRFRNLSATKSHSVLSDNFLSVFAVLASRLVFAPPCSNRRITSVLGVSLQFPRDRRFAHFQTHGDFNTAQILRNAFANTFPFGNGDMIMPHISSLIVILLNTIIKEYVALFIHAVKNRGVAIGLLIRTANNIADLFFEFLASYIAVS